MWVVYSDITQFRFDINYKKAFINERVIETSNIIKIHYSNNSNGQNSTKNNISI